MQRPWLAMNPETHTIIISGSSLYASNLAQLYLRWRAPPKALLLQGRTGQPVPRRGALQPWTAPARRGHRDGHGALPGTEQSCAIHPHELPNVPGRSESKSLYCRCGKLSQCFLLLLNESSAPENKSSARPRPFFHLQLFYGLCLRAGCCLSVIHGFCMVATTSHV